MGLEGAFQGTDGEWTGGGRRETCTVGCRLEGCRGGDVTTALRPSRRGPCVPKAKNISHLCRLNTLVLTP